MDSASPTKSLMDLLTIVWSEPSGRIFLLSAAYYLFSVFSISGYMAYFAGGFGNIGFGDYSLIDFLFFLPTVAITGLTIVSKNYLRVAKFITLYLVFPNLVGIMLASLVFNKTTFLSNASSLLLMIILYASFISWLVGVILLMSVSSSTRWISVLLQLLGSLFFCTAAVWLVTKNVMPPSPQLNPVIANAIGLIFNLIFLITVIGGSFLIILLIGMTIAREAIKNKYLSAIIRMELTQPVQGLEMWQTKLEGKAKNARRCFSKSSEKINGIYQYELNGQALLIASLKRVTAIYVNESDNVFKENGRLFLVSNMNIHSLELKSSKR